MAHHFALRIDSGLDEVKLWLAKYSLGGWCVRETVTGSNEHWHFHLVSDKTIKQLRCSFNRECPSLKGNGKYSLTDCRDVEKYDKYMAKGECEGQLPECVWTHGLDYSSEKISDLHDAYWLENRKLKKRKAGSYIDHVVDEAKRQNVRWDDRMELSKIYIRMLGAAGKPINLFSIRSNLNAVQYALCPDDACLEALAARVDQY